MKKTAKEAVDAVRRPKMVRRSVYLPEEWAFLLEKMSKKTDVSVNALIGVAIKNLLNDRSLAK